MVLTFARGHAEARTWLERHTRYADQIKGWMQGMPGLPGRDRDLARIYATNPRVPFPKPAAVGEVRKFWV